MAALPKNSEAVFRRFLDNELHQALAVLPRLRPPVSIAVMD